MRMLVLLISLAAVPASADVVGPDPTNCPLGTRPFVCHGIESCTPVPCVADGDCTTGQICQLRSLCTEPRTCGGRIEPDSALPPPVTTVNATCDGTCAAGTCESLSVCVPRGTPPGTGNGGCGCSIPSRSSTPVVPALLLIASLVRLRRRR